MSDCHAVGDLMDMLRRYIASTSEEPTLVGFYNWCKEHRYA